MCRATGYGFLAVLVWNRVSISTILVWNGVWFVHSSLELGMFIRRIIYFIIWRWDHFPYNVYANYRVHAVTACQALRSCTGLHGFRSEIGQEKSLGLVWNRGRVSGRVLHTPTQFFWKCPPGTFFVFGSGMGGHCARCSRRQADPMENVTKNHCVMEATPVLRRKLKKDLI